MEGRRRAALLPLSQEHREREREGEWERVWVSRRAGEACFVSLLGLDALFVFARQLSRGWGF